MTKSPDAFRTISEVSDWLETPAHVLRFWESKFIQIKPVKRAGGRRYYRPEDMALLGGIKSLLHEQGMTIKGVQKLLREQGVRHVASLGPQPLDGILSGGDAPLAGLIDDVAVDMPDRPVRVRTAPNAAVPASGLRPAPMPPSYAKPAPPPPPLPEPVESAAPAGLLSLLVAADPARLRNRRVRIAALAQQLAGVHERLQRMGA